jgi:hypothetical protein
MTEKRIIFISVLLTILFFIVGLLITPTIMEMMNRYFMDLHEEIIIVNSSIRQKFTAHLLTALSLAFIPVANLMISLLIIKLKGRMVSSWNYFFHLLIFITVFCITVYLKFYAFKFSIEKTMNYKISPELINTLQLNQIKLYDWPFYAICITAIGILLTVKKAKNS